MPKKVYNKLVRDKIPEIIENDGKKVKIRILNDAEYRDALFEKLQEEAEEVGRARNPKEMQKEIGDLREVISKIILELELDEKEIEETRKQRLKQRGGFEKKIFLEETND